MKLTTLASIITFSLIATTMIQASTQGHISAVKSLTNSNISIKTTYQSMTTAQLQAEVEKHSKNGSLSFALGQELIKRWTNS